MKKQIEEVQNYFKNRILAGDFISDAITTYHIKIFVDGYPFYIWIANDLKYCGIYESEKNFIHLPKFTDEEFATMKPIMERIIADRAEETRLKKISELEEELNKLKS